MGRIKLSLAVLIIASESGDDEGRGQTALLKVAGQALLEYQIRLMHACGGRHFVVLVEQLPAAMILLFDRLRDEGFDVDVARDARDAADRIHPQQPLLLLMPGRLPRRQLVEMLVARSNPALVTIASDQASQEFERLDAQDRWTGVARLNGRTVRETAGMLGDWSMGSTLVRQALQSGIDRMQLERPDDVALVETDKAATAYSATLIDQAADALSNVPGRAISRPVVTKLVGWLLPRSIPVDLIAVVPPVLVGAALILAIMGWHASGYLLLLMACLAATTADVVHKASVREHRLRPVWRWIKAGGYAASLLLSGWTVMSTDQDGVPLLLALWAVSLYPLSVDRASRPRWSASVESGALIMLIGTVMNWAAAGLALLVIHGLSEQFVARKAKSSNLSPP